MAVARKPKSAKKQTRNIVVQPVVVRTTTDNTRHALVIPPDPTRAERLTDDEIRAYAAWWTLLYQAGVHPPSWSIQRTGHLVDWLIGEGDVKSATERWYAMRDRVQEAVDWPRHDEIGSNPDTGGT